jgi:hypothetical protein
MKVIEISWQWPAGRDDDKTSSDNVELRCPLCDTYWLNVSEAKGEFNENACEHLMFKWYQDGEPEAVNVDRKRFERAIQESLGKVDRVRVIETLPEDFDEMMIWRLNENFWAGFQCPGIHTLVVGAARGVTLARHVFGIGGIPDPKKLRRTIRVEPL